jgi:putative thioredoxin
MSGAVDLAAVKARADAAARAAEAPAPAPGEHVVDVTEESFQAEVLDRSFQLPVLLVFWTARSPASAPLTDLLETVTTEAGGAMVLAKVDVDSNLRIAQALQVQGVPAVFAVIGGQLVPGFEGALPEAQVREFVAAVRAAGAEAGLSGAAVREPTDPTASEPIEPEPPADPRFDGAEQALADGDYDLARDRFQAILDVEPANAAAALALRQVALLARVEAADPAAAELAAGHPDDVARQLAAADLEFVADDADRALARLVDLVGRASAEDRDAVRERLLEYFDLLGPDDERVAPARRALARALF